jgi:hypothetical protein
MSHVLSLRSEHAARKRFVRPEQPEWRAPERLASAASSAAGRGVLGAASVCGYRRKILAAVAELPGKSPTASKPFPRLAEATDRDTTEPPQPAPVALPPTEAIGERRHVTVMFCDLVDSNDLSVVQRTLVRLVWRCNFRRRLAWLQRGWRRLFRGRHPRCHCILRQHRALARTVAWTRPTALRRRHLAQAFHSLVAGGGSGGR